MRSSDAGQTRGDRLFIALELSEGIKARLLGLQSLITGLNRTSPANLHLTLRFIGQVSPERADLVRQTLRGVGCAPFRLAVAGLGLFKRGTGAVLWAGVNPEPALIKLKQQADKALYESSGPIADEFDYSPHITLSRLKKPLSQPLKDLVQEKAAERFGEMTVTEFVLFRSLLRPSGAVHKPVERYRLNI